MKIEGVNKCGSCGITTNKGKYWGNGTYLCLDKCYPQWEEKDKKMRGDEFSVSKSIVKKVKKGKRNKKARVVTEIHKNGEQSRLTMFDE